jgi:hypothetical protein
VAQRPQNGPYACDVGWVVRDALEVAIVVAVGGLLVAAIGRLRRGEIRVYRCVACGRPTSRAYPRCKHCNVEQPDAI